METRNEGDRHTIYVARIMAYNNSMPQKYKGGHEEARKRYHQKSKERIRELDRARYERDKEKRLELNRKYHMDHKEELREYNKKWREATWPKLRQELLDAFGGKCNCCGETEPIFLQLDHIHNDGAQKRKEFQNGNQEILWLKRNGWPKENHQLLCANCNWGKQRNGGTCPHQSQKKA